MDRSLAVVGCFLLSASLLHGQADARPEATLESHDGKKTFLIGEPIRLDLVLRNASGLHMNVNTVDYGDNSDPVEISPKTGWFAWQGLSGHDYGTAMPLGPTAVRIPVRLDQVAVFRQAGHYEVRVTEDRVQSAATASYPRALPAITTNTVGIDLEEMPEAREAEIIRGAESDLANATENRAGGKLKRAAVERLATLQGNVALDEKVKLLLAENEAFRSVAAEAWATTRDLKHQLELLQAAWRNPQVKPVYDLPAAMNETRQLIADRPLAGWQMTVAVTKPDATGQQLIDAHRQDMVDLLNSMPQRTGDNRRDAAYYLIEFGGLPEADQQRAHNYAVDEFPQMESLAQHMLLETARPPFRDARLVPTLRTLLRDDPADKDALVAMLDIAPEDAVPFAVRAICAPKGPPLIEAFAKLKADRLPEVDGCLKPLLAWQAPEGKLASGRSYSGRASFLWQQRAMLAARFGTPALLSAIEESGRQQLAANPESLQITGGLLAAEMRDDPPAAVARLRQNSDLEISWYEADKVFESAHQRFPAEVTAWLRDCVENGTDEQARGAAYQLSLGGGPSDRAAVENRLARFRTSYRADNAKTNIPFEEDLVSALFNDRSWTPADRAVVTQGCVTEGCRRYAPH